MRGRRSAPRARSPQPNHRPTQNLEPPIPLPVFRLFPTWGSAEHPVHVGPTMPARARPDRRRVGPGLFMSRPVPDPWEDIRHASTVPAGPLAPGDGGGVRLGGARYPGAPDERLRPARPARGRAPRAGGPLRGKTGRAGDGAGGDRWDDRVAGRSVHHVSGSGGPQGVRPAGARLLLGDRGGGDDRPAGGADQDRHASGGFPGLAGGGARRGHRARDRRREYGGDEPARGGRAPHRREGDRRHHSGPPRVGRARDDHDHAGPHRDHHGARLPARRGSALGLLDRFETPPRVRAPHPVQRADGGGAARSTGGACRFGAPARGAHSRPAIQSGRAARRGDRGLGPVPRGGG